MVVDSQATDFVSLKASRPDTQVAAEPFRKAIVEGSKERPQLLSESWVERRIRRGSRVHATYSVPEGSREPLPEGSKGHGADFEVRVYYSAEVWRHERVVDADEATRGRV